MKTYVLYHANCWDGFCAAWIAKATIDGAVEFIPVQYGQDPPEMEAGSRVYILDFSYKRDVMRRILSTHHAVTVLDHHKTAEVELAGIVDEFIPRPDLVSNPPGSELPLVHFDMSKSGARLAWEHFMPGVQQCPGVVDYVEDRDLWAWALPDSKAVNACLRSYPLDFETWDRFALMDRDAIGEEFKAPGEAILRRERQIIDDHLRHAREIDMDGYKILAVNATTLFSEIAGELAEGRPFGACYFDRSDGKRQWSLRSRDGGVDVSAIAKARGGGGHPHASGFTEVLSHDIRTNM